MYNNLGSSRGAHSRRRGAKRLGIPPISPALAIRLSGYSASQWHCYLIFSNVQLQLFNGTARRANDVPAAGWPRKKEYTGAHNFKHTSPFRKVVSQVG